MRAESGTISPELERTFSRPMSSARARYCPSACTRTVGAAELVEVVHVQAAEVDLHRVEYFRHRHAELALVRSRSA